MWVGGGVGCGWVVGSGVRRGGWWVVGLDGVGGGWWG